MVLAAGQSRRMGQPKMALPWGDTTVIRRVVDVLLEGGAKPVVVVSGAAEKALVDALTNAPVSIVRNENYDQGDMLGSLQCGLRQIQPEVSAVLVALGDQPQVEPAVVALLIDAYQRQAQELIVPSYKMRKGHPWLLGRSYWAEIRGMGKDESLRDFLGRHASEIVYVNVTTSSILKDLDTPEDYAVEQPKNSHETKG